MPFKILLMAIRIEGIIKMGSLTEEDSIFGKMVLPIEVISKMGWDKVKGIGQVKMEINIKEIIAQIAKMVLDNLNGWMEIFIKVSSAKIWDKGMAQCFGVMEVYIKDSGAEDFLMEKVLNMLTK